MQTRMIIPLPDKQSTGRHIRSLEIWAFPIGCLLLASVLTLTGLTEPVFLLLNGWFNRLLPASFWLHITNGGDGYVAIALSLPFCVRNSRFVIMLMGAGLFMAWVPRTIKAYHSLPRPPALLDPEQYTLIGDAYYGGAFPSGHTATIFFIVALVFFMYQKPGPRIIAFIAGILVGASRIACGIHWPTDVLAGAALGWVISACAYIVFSSWPKHISPAAEGVLHRLPVLAVAAGVPWYETAYEGTRMGFVVVCVAMISLWGWLNVVSAKSS